MNTQQLREKFGSKMSLEQCEHIEGIIEKFAHDVYEKYAKGQAEHGGNLWKKDIILPELLNETLDFVVYGYTLARQIKESGIKLGESLPD